MKLKKNITSLFNNFALISVFLMLLNLLVKGLFLDHNSLGGDEPFTVYHAQMDIFSIIRLLSDGNNPPLFELILHYWIKVFGISELSVRLPSLFFSSFTVFFIYKLAHKHLNSKVALYASIIFIFSNYFTLYAQEARVYSLLGLLSIMSMNYFLDIINECKTYFEAEQLVNSIKLKIFALILINSLIIYAHYFGFFILLTQFIFIIYKRSIFIQYWKQILLIISTIGILYLPNVIVFYTRLIESSTKGTWVKAPKSIDSIYNMIRKFANEPLVATLVIAVFLASIVKYFIKRKVDSTNWNSSFIVFWFVFIFFFMFGISYLIPMFLDRYLIPSAIAFSILVAISIDYIVKKPRYSYITPIVICALFIATVKPSISNKRNVRETINKLIELKTANTLVLVCPQHFVLNFAYYYDSKIFKNINVKNPYFNIENDLKIQNIFSIKNISEVNFKEWDDIIYLDAGANFSFPNNNIIKKLNKSYILNGKHEFYQIFKIFDYKLKQP